MKTGFLITARLRSTRLPRKLLLPLDNSNVIGKVIERAKQVEGMEQVVLCTSTLPGDDELVDIAAREGIASFRGDPEDVMVRLRDACRSYGYGAFVGITGEDPIFDAGHCRQAREELERGADLVSFSKLPIGCSAYGVGLAALETVCAFKQEVDTEIWGYLINRPEVFNVRSIDPGADYAMPDVRLTIDYPEDYELMKAIYAVMPGMPDVAAVIALLRQRPDLLAINAMRKQADLDAGMKQRINDWFLANKERITAHRKAQASAISE
ncbi:MAG: 3-deoxy-manno-octulosonate cytidylyltransferase [Flavobacteriales bacterium]